MLKTKCLMLLQTRRIAAMQVLLSELQGIVAVAQQQLTRVITQCLMTNDTPHCAANAESGVIRGDASAHAGDERVHHRQDACDDHAQRIS